MPQALRQRLDAERSKDGRSLSEEVVIRLTESFDLERKDVDRFGGKELFWLFRTMWNVIKDIEVQTRRSFRDDAYTFVQAKEAIGVLFGFFRPAGKPALPEHLAENPLWTREMQKTLGKRQATFALAAMEMFVKSDRLDHEQDRSMAAKHLVRKMTNSPTAKLLRKARTRKAPK